MKSPVHIICLLLLLLPEVFYAQAVGNTDSSVCYSEKEYALNEVFTKTEIPPKFREKAGLHQFLAGRINVEDIVPASVVSLTDTARVRFILGSNAAMSNLAVETPNALFKTALIRAIKASACFWKPGGFNGREVNSWVVLDVFYTVERGENRKWVSIGYNIVDEWNPGSKAAWID